VCEFFFKSRSLQVVTGGGGGVGGGTFWAIGPEKVNFGNIANITLGLRFNK
jgi:hypothetical protein